MALRAIVKKEFRTPDRTAIIRELPRVMTLYDVDVPLIQARKVIMYHFRKNSHITDGGVTGLLIAKGYMELEETLMQWKQKSHLLRILEPIELTEAARMKNLTEEQKFYAILQGKSIN